MRVLSRAMPENVVMEDSWAPEDRRDKTQCNVYKKQKRNPQSFTDQWRATCTV